MTTYRTCAVPMCKSTSIKCPNKLFIHVPRELKRRKQWLQLARRDPKFTSDKSAVFFCEDHFDLPNDMENYIQYGIMGSVGKIRMKPDCLPSKFQCQPDRLKRTAPPQPRSAVNKKIRMDIIQEILSEGNEIPAISGMTSNNDFQSATKQEGLTNFQDQATQVCPEANNKLVQVSLRAKFRSKAVQTTSHTKDKNTSPIKNNCNTSTATSPIKITKSGVVSAKFGNIKDKETKLFTSEKLEVSSSNSSSPSKHSQLNTDISPSVQSLLTMTSTSSDPEIQSELSEIKQEVETEDADELCRISTENTVRFIIICLAFSQLCWGRPQKS